RSRFSLAVGDRHLASIAKIIGRMGHHLFALLEPAEDLDAQAGPMARLDRAHRNGLLLAIEDEGRPLLAMPEERARGRLENPLLLPGDDASLDSIGFAKARPALARRDEIDDDDDALLLDAERRDIRERHGLDRPHAPEEDVAASPALELDLRARLDTN